MGVCAVWWWTAWCLVCGGECVVSRGEAVVCGGKCCVWCVEGSVVCEGECGVWCVLRGGVW